MGRTQAASRQEMDRCTIVKPYVDEVGMRRGQTGRYKYPEMVGRDVGIQPTLSGHLKTERQEIRVWTERDVESGEPLHCRMEDLGGGRPLQYPAVIMGRRWWQLRDRNLIHILGIETLAGKSMPTQGLLPACHPVPAV